MPVALPCLSQPPLRNKIRHLQSKKKTTIITGMILQGDLKMCALCKFSVPFSFMSHRLPKPVISMLKQFSSSAVVQQTVFSCKFSLLCVQKTKILLISALLVVVHWNRRFGCETIHPSQKFISMNLLQVSFVITWA